MKDNRLLKWAAMLACAACSSCSPEKDADADEVEERDGRSSVYGYEFEGRGTPHSEDEVAKYGLDEFGRRGSDVSARVHIEWPEARSGLSKDALAKVRKAILWMAFASEAPTRWKTLENPVRYIVPEALGETDESLKSRIKELDGEWEDGEFGLQPKDWDSLTCDALSLHTGRLPAKDDGRVTDATLQLALAGIRKRAEESYACDPSEVNHCCSRWNFIADVHLDWPFGVEPKDDAKWYEWPVVCVWSDGYSNDGGNGCHSLYYSKVYSLPDGREVNVDDYFAADKLHALYDYVWKRLLADNGIERDGDPQEDRNGVDLTGSEVSMLVTKEGVKWSLAPYSYFAGCYGIVSVMIKWDELADFTVPKGDRKELKVRGVAEE